MKLTKAWKGLAATVNQPVPGRAWKITRTEGSPVTTEASKAKKPTMTKVKGGDWQYKGSKVEIHLELGQETS